MVHTGLTYTAAAVPLAWVVCLLLHTLRKWVKTDPGARNNNKQTANSLNDEDLAEPLLSDHTLQRHGATATGTSNGNGNGNGTAHGYETDESSGASTDKMRDGVYKKGTALHWTKLCFYMIQVGVHVSAVVYYALQDRAIEDRWRWITQAMLAAAWAGVYAVQCLHHSTLQRRNSPLQLAAVVLLFLSSLTLLLDDKSAGSGSIRAVQLAPWDLGWILLIAAVEVYSCCRDVPVVYYEHMNEEYSAGLVSYFNFNWYTFVIDIGYKRPLQTADLPVMIDHDRAASVWTRFSQLVYARGQNSVTDGEDLKIGIKVLQMSGYRLYLQAFWSFLGSVMQVVPALALHVIVQFMSDYRPNSGEKVPLTVVLCVAGLFLSQALATYADAMMFKLGRRLGIRAKAGLISAVFRKAMTLDMGSANAGQLQNHISVDAESVLNLMVFQMFMWGAVLRLFACIALLFFFLGLSAFGGIGLLIITLPLNNYIIGKLKMYQQQLMKRRDVRMGVVQEAIQGIRIIKLFAWEDNFINKIMTARGTEIALLRVYMFTLGVFMVVVKSSPTIVGLVTFLVHTQAFGYRLTAATGFTALTLFNQLRMPLAALPSTINDYIQARISFKRINKLLSSTAHDVKSLSPSSTSSSSSSSSSSAAGGNDRHCKDLRTGELKIIDGTFRWRSAVLGAEPTLRDINVHIKPGELTCVYGPTGSGKSSLLMSLLQELVTIKGRALMNGNVAYASQKAWIQNATVRDNILFGAPYDANKYNAVIDACALRTDLAILEYGDQTEIGEKGVNLSGGQQQRLSLARAVYNDADIVLLDDILSAVDAHVGKHIFDKCINGYLRGKTVVLVTHQVSLTAKHADKIIILASDGTVRESGSYRELSRRGADSYLTEMLTSLHGADSAALGRQGSDASIDSATGAAPAGADAAAADGSTAAATAAGAATVVQADASSKSARSGSSSSGWVAVPTVDKLGSTGDAAAATAAGAAAGGEEESTRGKIIMKETVAQGNPKLTLYLRYCRFCGGKLFAVGWLLLSVLWQALTVAQSFTLKQWIDEMTADIDNGPSFWRYVAVSVASFGALLARTVLITSGSIKASKSVHDAVTARVFGAPISFFDATPLGRIINRFSSDIVTLDKDLMNDINTYCDMLFSVIGVVAVVAVGIPILTVAMIPVLGMCYWYGNRYLQTSRQLKRLESINRSPLYAHFSESVSGASTIRSYEAEGRFITINEQHIDTVNRSHIYLWCANYWLTNRVRLLGSIVCGLVGLFLILDVDNIDAASGGLVLTYVLQYTIAVTFTIRLHAQMEMSVNSIERLDEYCKIEQERPAVVSTNRPAHNWPSQGKMAFRNVTLKYASSSEPVLHGISFDVPAGASVGIVGRTGAGKSSLANALFRIVECQDNSVIEIDGVNIMNIGLQDLRRRLAIIPQEPQLFEGTIRSNADPFSEYSDVQIWAALEQCHLGDFVRGTSLHLQHEITAGGTNLSVGQRQLLCLARALLRQAKVLLMDEITANIDYETDAAIQETLADAFGNCTRLCIAHRLATVVVFDVILVLQAGRVLEYDTPTVLLRDKNSTFYSMCEQTGDLKNLIRLAEEASAQRAASATK